MKLPIIKWFRIEHLSLFKEPIERDILPGINMIIGVNGVGKTTLVNTLLFGLVGNTMFEALNVKTGKIDSIALVSRNYFRGRIRPIDQERARVRIIFHVASASIDITRDLFRPHIVQFEVDNQGTKTRFMVSASTEAEIEERYQEVMCGLLEIEKYQDFVFVVANLLVFDESRRTLMWDVEVQNDLLRLLVTANDFNQRFLKLSTDVTDSDTRARHLSETRKDIIRSVERWTKGKQDASMPKDGSDKLSQEQAEYELAQILTKLDELEDIFAIVQEKIAEEEDHLKALNAQSDQLEIKKTAVSQRIDELEYQFYSSVYQGIPPDYLLILETLAKYGTCQVCGTKGSNLAMLGESLKQQGLCMVCRSPIRYDMNNGLDPDDKNVIELLNGLRAHFQELNEAQSSCNKAIEKTRSVIQELQNDLSQKSRERRVFDTRASEIRTKYIIDVGTEPFQSSQSDEWLTKQQEDIAELTSKIESLYRERDTAREQLNELNLELVKRLHKVNEDLTPHFSHYASRFLGVPCELVISQITRQKKPVAFLYPRFNEQDRELSTEVSESQRFFLDQAFRMALISWFTNDTDQPTFFVVETPEGSLDLAYERNVADMYVEFGTFEHSVIVTSNLNSSNFLNGLYSAIEDESEKTQRTLNLLSFGQLTPVHEKYRKDFSAKATQLSLQFV